MRATALYGALVIVGGGGLIAQTFMPMLNGLSASKTLEQRFVGWGLRESLHVDRKGGIVLPFAGDLPNFMDLFYLVGLRDFGTSFDWVPCVSCKHSFFDEARTAVHDIVVYEHKRIPLPIEGFPRRMNDGSDLRAVLDFLGSASLVITNSYHGAYWATLLGRRVLAIPNMSKIYRMRHAPVICRPDNWKKYVDLTSTYPEALAQCRQANDSFYKKVVALHTTMNN